MNREQLLAARSSRVHRVKVDGVGEVCVRALSGRQMLALEASFATVEDKTTWDGKARLGAMQLAAYICDDEGKAVLSFEDALQLLDDWTGAQITAVVTYGTKINSLGEDGVEEAGKN